MANAPPYRLLLIRVFVTPPANPGRFTSPNRPLGGLETPWTMTS